MRRQFDDFFGGYVFAFFMHMMRMHAHAAKDIRQTFGRRTHCYEFTPRRADIDHTGNTRRLRARDNALAVFDKRGVI
jgi:hypothetical protein